MKQNLILRTLIIVMFMGYIGGALVGQTESGISHPDRPNILWITSEDNSIHYLSIFDENGVETPNISSLAKEGIMFTHTFSNAPVCSVARSTLMSGCYAPRIGSQFHRKMIEVPMPESLMMFPKYLQANGYYTTNKNKEDYNILKPPELWDESSKNASWKNRAPGQPFFHMVNINVSHEGALHFSKEQMDAHETYGSHDNIFVQPFHPNTALFRYTNAYYLEKIQLADKRVGQILRELEDDNLTENTIVFYFGDHGGSLPRSKGYLYETGLHVPLVVYIPPKYREVLNMEPGSVSSGFVNFVDIAPTVLSLVGIEVPDQMDGKPFLGQEIDNDEVNSRDEAYGYADRFDEKYDMVRSIRKGRYKYIRNFQPFNVEALRNQYRYNMLAYQEWEGLYKSGELNEIQARFFKPKSPEMLFDIEADPYEIHNLANDEAYKDILVDMRSRLFDWLTSLPDLSFYPEYILIKEAFDNPSKFGQSHAEEIRNYMNIANLCLEESSKVEEKLIETFRSNDPWERYWGLIASTSLTDQSENLKGKVKEMIAKEDIPLNRMQAAIYMAINMDENPFPAMFEALYQSQYPTEALYILNSIVLMRDWYSYKMSLTTNQARFEKKYSNGIDLDKIKPEILEDEMVKIRLEYLNRS